MSKEAIIQLVYRRLPHSAQIKELDITSEQNAIRLDWRGDRFRVSESLMVEQVLPGVLARSNLAICIEALLKGGEQ